MDPRFGKVGKQTIKDTGPLTKKRMETVDDDFAARSVDFIKRENAAGKPVFVWVNFTHMHFRTHVKPESLGQSGSFQSHYHDAMIDHDKNVGTVLKAIDDLGIADNTIVMYSTDNGPHMNSWPDAAMTPFRSEKNSNWEGAYRVPAMVRWPGHIKAGTVDNDIVSHLDWMPTLLAAAGVPDVKEQLLKGMKVGDTTFKVHLDGYNLLPLLTGEVKEESAQGVLLLQRRQRSGRPALRQLEDRLHGTAGPGHDGDLEHAVCHPARAEDLQSSHRPLRARRHHVEHLLRLAARPCVCVRAGAGHRRPVHQHVQGIPAEPEGRQLQPGRCSGQDAGRRDGQQTNARLTETLNQITGPHPSRGGCGPTPRHNLTSTGRGFCRISN